MRDGAFIWEKAHSYERMCIHMEENAFIWEKAQSYERRPLCDFSVT